MRAMVVERSIGDTIAERDESCDSQPAVKPEQIAMYRPGSLSKSNCADSLFFPQRELAMWRSFPTLEMDHFTSYTHFQWPTTAFLSSSLEWPSDSYRSIDEESRSTFTDEKSPFV